MPQPPPTPAPAETVEGIPPVAAGLALESMRNSSFDTVSAIGEVIDNSIEAGATSIQLRFEQTDENKGQRGRPRVRTTRVVVSDDGSGMDNDTLYRCLQLGFSTRWNDRTGIGRFGVGMTLGAINQCRHVEVYSKQGGPFQSTYLDLDEIEKAGDNAVIPPPKMKDPPPGEAKLLHGTTGTIVIWSKIDRMEENDVERILHWIGRTYRKFIANKLLKDSSEGATLPKLVPNPKPVNIDVSRVLDTKPTDYGRVRAFDPLYHYPTAIDGDPESSLVESIDLRIPLKDATVDMNKHGTEATVSIRMALLPEKLRSEEGAGGDREAQKRFIPDNTGISILRNGREVYWGSWLGVLGLGGAQESYQIDRYWGAEIEFPAVLDRQFQVRNIKTGARPLPDLAETLTKKMKNQVVDFREQVRAHWTTQRTETRLLAPEGARDHIEAEEIAAVSGIHPPRSGEMEPTKEQKQEFLSKLLPEAGNKTSQEDLLGWANSQTIPYKILETKGMDPKGPFMDIRPYGATTFIDIALRHPFFEEVFQLLKEVDELASKTSDPISQQLKDRAKLLKTSLDLLLIAYAHAHSTTTAQGNDDERRILERLVAQWSIALREYTNQLKQRKGGAT